MSKFTRCFRICAVLLLLGAVFPAPGLEIPPLSGKIVDQAQVLQEQAPAIAAALEQAAACKDKPTVILARTIKGKGVSYMENNAGWHGKAPNDEQYEIAKAELERALAELEAN